jgi:hypothetical protein
MNEQGQKLGVYIDSGTTERHYRQRIRAGIRRDPMEYEASHREARRQGRYYEFDEDLPTATGTARTNAETTMPMEIETVDSNTLTAHMQSATEGITVYTGTQGSSRRTRGDVGGGKLRDMAQTHTE